MFEPIRTPTIEVRVTIAPCSNGLDAQKAEHRYSKNNSNALWNRVRLERVVTAEPRDVPRDLENPRPTLVLPATNAGRQISACGTPRPTITQLFLKPNERHKLGIGSENRQAK
jgi:hypothetical protein